MSKLIRNIFILIVIIIFIIHFSPSYVSYSIDNLAFVVALGIDVGTNDKFKISFQFVDVTAVSEGGSSGEKIPTILNTVEAPSITAAVNLMNSYLGKELNLSHCKLFVFSEKVAIEGISEQIYTLMNNIKVRPTANVVISKCDASYYIDSTIPSLEHLITKYYDIFPTTGKYTGYTYNATIGDFFYNITSQLCDSVAILGGINSADDINSVKTSNPLQITNITANNLPIKGERKTENIGLAVFKDATLVR